MLQRVERVFGRCTAFYTVENGKEGNHLHLNILYQFGQAIDKERLLEILKSVTTLSDITVQYVNNVENMIDYMTKEEGCYQVQGGTTREMHNEDIYRIQHAMNVAGNEQRRKRPTMQVLLEKNPKNMQPSQTDCLPMWTDCLTKGCTASSQLSSPLEQRIMVSRLSLVPESRFISGMSLSGTSGNNI